MGGLAAAKRGECDIAPVHLMEPETGEYNRPFLVQGLELVSGYRRLQGIVFRPEDPRFRGHRSALDAVALALTEPESVMVNRNAGSGTRILIDRVLLKGAKPPGTGCSRNHTTPWLPPWRRAGPIGGLRLRALQSYTGSVFCRFRRSTTISWYRGCGASFRLSVVSSNYSRRPTFASPYRRQGSPDKISPSHE
jgi:hypothetical protein